MRGESDALRRLCAHAVLWLIVFVVLGAVSLSYVHVQGFEGIHIRHSGQAVNISRHMLDCRETQDEILRFACRGTLQERPLSLEATLPRRNWLLATCAAEFDGRPVPCSVGHLSVSGRFYAVMAASHLGLTVEALHNLRIANWPINLPEHSAMGLAGLAALALALHIGLLLARRLDGHVLLRLAAAAAAGAGIFVLLFWTLVTALGITGFVD